MGCRLLEGLGLIAGLLAAALPDAAANGKPRGDLAVAAIETAAKRIDIAGRELNTLTSAVASEPDEDFWALQIGDRRITAAVAPVPTSSPPLHGKVREAASRRAAFQAMAAAFFPDLRVLLDSLGCVNRSAQRRALGHVISDEQVHGIVELGSVSTTLVEGDLAVAVLVVPHERVRLILPVENALGRERLLRAYQKGLRDEALGLMARNRFGQALTAWHELRQMVSLSSDELISVARCFAEEGKRDEANAVILSLVRDTTLTVDQLMRCGDVAFSAKNESLATGCYDRSSALIESPESGSLDLILME